MPCLLCRHTIHRSEPSTILEFAGDALVERGRYAVHSTCMRPEWRTGFITREQLMVPGLASNEMAGQPHGPSPCFLCGDTIDPAEACGPLEFAGDALAERGRYAVHWKCLRPEWRKRWVTREELLAPSPQTEDKVAPQPWQGITPQSEGYRMDIALPRDTLAAIPQTPPRGLLAQFFLWGARRFAGGRG